MVARAAVVHLLHVQPISGGTIWLLGRWSVFGGDVSKETIHVHNYHCKRDTGMVRVGILYGPRLGAWYMDYGLAARDAVARAASSRTRALKTYGVISR